VILYSLLLLAAVVSELVLAPEIIIEACVDVDPAEVRRLTAIELGNWHGATSLGEFQVVVACNNGTEELRLTDRTSGSVSVRIIDLSAPRGRARDANARELALAIAELARRSDVEAAVDADSSAATPAREPKLKSEGQTKSERQPGSEGEREVALGRAPVWRAELGIAGAGSVWTGGQTLLGADVSGRVHLNRWLIAEVRVGAKATRPVYLESGSIQGRGLSGAVGLALDATPSERRAGVAFGARLGVDWLDYAVQDSMDRTSNHEDAVATHLAGTTTGFVVLSDPLCLTVDASAGFPLHSIAIRENNRSAAQVDGVSVSGALGLAAQF
jgi:hypothetical protein